MGRGIQHSPLTEKGVIGVRDDTALVDEHDAFGGMGIEANSERRAVDMDREDFVRAKASSVEFAGSGD
jgi:hypothetical protein